MSAIGLLLLGAALWVVAIAALLFAHWRDLARMWREPVLVCPILILDSDDWGAGPLAQAAALRQIVAVLERHVDAAGRHPTMNLALVLAVPDGQRIVTHGRYHRLCLDAPLFAPIMAELHDGVARGVLALQLHGLEHYWPEALMHSRDEQVSEWLRATAPAATERLPSHLQSRWTNSVTLPSTPLPTDDIRQAAEAEVVEFRRTFGRRPAVVVPPTFVWTRNVELAWASQGVQIVVTPGWRSTCRNSAGAPDADEGPIVSGDQSDGLTYIVRTDYFEPVRGRDAAHALLALAKASGEGRPCLLENHRDNFIFDAEQCRQSLSELDALYVGALRQHPDLRFLSTVELGCILRSRDPRWIVQPWRERLPYVWQRLPHNGRPWKLMRLTGLAALGNLFVRLLGRRPTTAPAGAAS